MKHYIEQLTQDKEVPKWASLAYNTKIERIVIYVDIKEFCEERFERLVYLQEVLVNALRKEFRIIYDGKIGVGVKRLGRNWKETDTYHSKEELDSRLDKKLKEVENQLYQRGIVLEEMILPKELFVDKVLHRVNKIILEKELVQNTACKVDTSTVSIERYSNFEHIRFILRDFAIKDGSPYRDYILRASASMDLFVCKTIEYKNQSLESFALWA
jgi:hypothetical protein